MSRDLLIELGTEELPPKALPNLSAALTDEFVRQLDEAGLNHGDVESFAAPRRLAVLVRGLDDKQADRDIERQGPAVQAAFDKDGNPTKAAQGFAASLGLTVDQLAARTQARANVWSPTLPSRASPPLSWCRNSLPRQFRNCRSPSACAGANARYSLCAPRTGLWRCLVTK